MGQRQLPQHSHYTVLQAKRPRAQRSGPKSQGWAGLKKAAVKTWLGRMNRFTRNMEKGGSWFSTRQTAAESTVKQGNFTKGWPGCREGQVLG